VSLIVEIQAIGDEFFELDIDRAVEGTSAAETGTPAFATFTAALTAAFATAFGTTGRASARAAIAAGPVASATIFAAGLVTTASFGTSFGTGTAALGFGLRAFLFNRFRLDRLGLGRLGDRSLLRLGSFDVFYYRLDFF
jgi:hypothetical protein